MTRPGQDPQFDRYASSYRALHQQSIRLSGELPDFFAAHKADYVAGHLGDDPPRRVLDFGCGVGGSLPHLRRRFPGAALVGTDVSSESLALAREGNPDVELVCIEDGARIPLPDASVDTALAACVFHHIPPVERAGWVAELRRVLRPGGRFFVFEHNPLNPLTRKVVRDCPFDEDAVLLPARETTSLLRAAGFGAVTLDYIVFFPQMLAALRRFERHLGWLPAGAQYVVHGQA